MLNTSPQTATPSARAPRKTKGTGSPRRVGLDGPVPAIENFALIIGSMKCGTTSLYDYLVTHPQIAQCQVKEPNFFGSRKWELGADYYCRHWSDFDPARHAYALEASVDYTKLPRARQAAPRIAGFGRDFKFMFIARNPVDRVESHIAHNISKGRITPENYAGMMESAISVSRYAFQLDSFRKEVDDQEVLVLDFEHLKRDPIALLDRCVRFLGIDEDFVFEPRPPSNQRRAVNGAEDFRLSPEERETVAARLAGDAQRFAECYDFDISAWNMPVPKPEAKTSAAGPPVWVASAPVAVAAVGKSEPEDKGYWQKRRDMLHYQYVRAMVGRLGAEARSLIDIGSHDTGLIEEFDWIPERVTLDPGTPYSSAAVTGITADFFDYRPDARFDFALCLQVLEHIADAEGFARKLLDLSDRVLVSVPYKWPGGGPRAHVQNPIDKNKLALWFGRAPDYQIVVEEPLRRSAGARRLIAYFHAPGTAFDLKKLPEGRSRAPKT